MAINTTTQQCNTSPSLMSPNIKQEKMDKLSPMQQTANVSIAFSITNILSNNFGNNNSKVISEKRNGSAFRSHDDGSPSPKKRKFDRQFEDDDSNGGANDDEEIDVTNDHAQIPPNGAIDFSGALSNSSIHRFAHSILSPQQHAHHLHQQQLLSHYQAAMAVAQQSLQRASEHGFMDSPLDVYRTPIYPEFYHPNQQQQALAKQYQQYYQTSLLSDSALSKYAAPLGNLCKTVSQIGQSPSTASTPNGNKLVSPAISEPSPSKKPLSRPSSQTSNTVQAKVSGESSSAAAALKSSSAKTNDVPATVKTSRLESMDSGMESSDDTKSETSSNKDENGSQLFPAWIYCTRYSDRPSSGPRYRKPKTPKAKGESDEKRPRTAFSSEQLARLKREFNENHYLNESRRQQLSSELGLDEAQIKIWFQNRRAKIKKSTGQKNPLAMQLMAQGLYNHSTVALTKEEEELEMRMNGQL